jgi:hypothetical protein
LVKTYQPAAILKLAVQASLYLTSALEGEGAVTQQRRLAARIGLVLTLTNILLKRCVCKGLIKVSQVPATSCLNYITLQGFKEKRRLVSECFGSARSFFCQFDRECSDIFEHLNALGFARVDLTGHGLKVRDTVTSSERPFGDCDALFEETDDKKPNLLLDLRGVMCKLQSRWTISF